MNTSTSPFRLSHLSSTLLARRHASLRARFRIGLALAAGLVATAAHAQSVYATPYFLTTLAGVATSGSLDGTLSGARFSSPQGVAVEANGTVYVADTNNHIIRKITFFGVVTTLAGQAGALGNTNGTGTAARFNLPAGLAVDSAGNVYVADTSNSLIRKITPGGLVTTLAGGTAGSLDGTGSAARFLSPNGIAVDAAGNVYVGDTANHLIRKITPAGVVTTLAGVSGSFGSNDGTGAGARFASPRGVAVDASGNIYVADRDNNMIRKVTAAGVVTTLAGVSNGFTGSTDGTGTAARFNSPYGIAVDSGGNVYVTEGGNHTIRKISPTAVVTTLAGLAGSVGFADGTGNVVRFRGPRQIAADGRGNLYVADQDNHTIRMSVFAPDITPQPISQVVAPGASATFTSGATSNVPITTHQWQKDGTAIAGATTATIIPSPNTPTATTGSLTVSNIQTANLGNYTLVATNMVGSSTSNAGVLSFTPPPSFLSQPGDQSVAPGASATFTAIATSTIPITYQWQKDGISITGATTTTLIVSNVQVANLGNYTLIATNAVGPTTSNPAALAFIVSTAGRLTNLAIRTNAGTGAQTLIVGVVVGGANTTGTKPLLIRGVGPTLGVFGVPGFLVDPTLSVFSGTTVVSSNDNWNGDAQITAIGTQVGAFAYGTTTSRDAALYSSALIDGPYTVQISGVGGTTGITLAEIYDATPVNVFLVSTPRLINVSARTQVGTGADILIAGFTIGGITPKTLLIRAVGPTLGVFGVTGVLTDPRLDLYSGANVINSNDNWGGGAAITAAATSVGAFALDGASRDAVLLVTLAPGSYTAQVSGVNNTIGVALVEIYDVP